MEPTKEQLTQQEEARRQAEFQSADRFARTLGCMVVVPVLGIVVLIVVFGLLMASGLQ